VRNFEQGLVHINHKSFMGYTKGEHENFKKYELPLRAHQVLWSSELQQQEMWRRLLNYIEIRQYAFEA